MARYVVDSSIWIKLLRREHRVKERFSQVLPDPDAELIVTPVAYYEVLRGLAKRRDDESLVFVKTFWETLSYVEATKPIWDEAIRLWVLAVSQNQKREDADTLTAAFASVLGAVIVTDDESHFSTFGIPTENWAA